MSGRDLKLLREFAMKSCVRPFRVGSFLAVVGALFAVQPASADFLYDYTSTFLGTTHVEFTEPAILMSTTTVNSFLLATSTIGTVQDVVVDPIASGSCRGAPGPCVEVDFTNGGNIIGFNFPTVNSTGTFSNGGGNTLTISLQAVPEPSSVVLLLTAIGAVAFAFRKRLRSE